MGRTWETFLSLPAKKQKNFLDVEIANVILFPSVEFCVNECYMILLFFSLNCVT